MSIEIELALIDLSLADMPSKMHVLSNDYVIEDRASNGWGVVVRYTRDNSSEDVDAFVVDFLKGLTDLEAFIAEMKSVLSIAIYTENVGYTLHLNSFE